MLEQLCAPAVLYIAFSLTQIVIDIFKNMYNTAMIKFVVMIVFSIALNILCKKGLSVISWFIVFVPFIMMTIITSLLLFVFGLSPMKGGLDYNVTYPAVEASKTNVTVVKANGHKLEKKPSTATTAASYNPTDMASGTPDEINNYSS